MGVKKSYYSHCIMKTGFIYSDAYFDYDYGPAHPLKIVRLKLTFELIKAYGLLDLPSVQTIITKHYRGQVYFVSIVFPREESKKVRCLLFPCC